MIVGCPQCDTAYRAPSPSGLPGAIFRCSRCDHVFELTDAGAEPPLDDDERSENPAGSVAPRTERDASEEKRAGSSAARFALRTLVGVTLAFAVLSAYLFMHPGRVTEMLARVPLVGADLAATRLNPAHIQLTDVRGEFTRVQGGTLVFVVTGTAVNNAPVPVSAIQIRGRILGPEEQRRLVFAGTAPRDVHDLSEREIELLQTLRPPGDWRLLPGQDGEFLVAFVDPPLPVRELAAEVVAVRRRDAR